MFKRIVFVTFGLFIVLMVVGLVVSLSSPARRVAKSTPTVPVTEPPKAVPSPAKAWQPTTQEVADRAKLIERLQAQGVLGDLRVANHVGRVVVGPKFLPLDFKQRQSFASVAFAWCLDTDADCKLLVLHDGRSNKEIGRFGDVYGGLKMD